MDWRQFPRNMREQMPPPPMAMGQRPPAFYGSNFPPMYLPEQQFPRDRFPPNDWRMVERDYNRREYDRRPQ